MDIVPALFLVTFAIALVLGLWQLYRARKARRERHRSAAAREQGEPWSRR